jgi:putative FmdB family regulatory protein
LHQLPITNYQLQVFGATMPTYEYACSACGHEFEEFQGINAKPTVKCPKCGKRTVKRLISAGAGFIFKGSGFYTTDYRSESYKADAKSDSGPAKTDTAVKTDAPAAKVNGKADAGAKAAPAKTDAAPAKTETKSVAKSAK